MMEHTDSLFRRLFRLISRRTLLYTEMIHVRAALGPRGAAILAFEPEERPLALQLGGDDPALLARAARVGEEMGYDEINLNVGCPSERVQSGAFGACLMAMPDRVAEMVAAMRAAVRLPVTVKHRTGIDRPAALPGLLSFVDPIARAGADRLIIHARIAILKGLSPKENRSVPPLDYSLVHALKSARPAAPVEINGGIVSLDEAGAQLKLVDGVMIGRAAYSNPWLFADADSRFYGDLADSTPLELRRWRAVEGLLEMLATMSARDGRTLLRHAAGLFTATSGARRWRQILNQAAHDAKPYAALRELIDDGGRFQRQRDEARAASPAGSH